LQCSRARHSVGSAEKHCVRQLIRVSPTKA